MNGRKAKFLRKMAAAMEECIEQGDLNGKITSYQDYAAPRFIPVNGKGALANQVVDYVKVANGIPRKLTENYIRSIYQKLK